jgi:uncharacterized membrane protein YoaK (UPF0700 family)
MIDRRVLETGFLLTAIAGWVDAQGFLLLNGVFVSFMSGNTTLLGLAIAPGHWGQAGPIAVVIALFLVGGFAGAFLAGASQRWAMPVVLATVAATLAVALVLSVSGGPDTVAAFVLALAMGTQNTAAVAAGSVKAGATYVTGTLVSAGHELGKIAAGSGSVRVFVGHMSLWLALLAGVIAGAAGHAFAGPAALAVPCAAAAGLAGLAFISAGRSISA